MEMKKKIFIGVGLAVAAVAAGAGFYFSNLQDDPRTGHTVLAFGPLVGDHRMPVELIVLGDARNFKFDDKTFNPGSDFVTTDSTKIHEGKKLWKLREPIWVGYSQVFVWPGSKPAWDGWKWK